MNTIILVLTLLVALVISQLLALFFAQRLRIAIPTPLIQIAVGVFFASFTEFDTVVLQPELFLLLFLPPLLFSDGWRIPNEGLLRDKGTILELAILLVIFTLIVGGYFIHWLIPTMPLTVAFALAAIMSPTDPVAVSAITTKVKIPTRLLLILQGESLLNDASSLVSMRFAIAATLTGSFSLIAAFGTFLWTALAGLLVGVITTYIINRCNNWVLTNFQSEESSQFIISLLIPFISYLLAEYIDASGILAAVAAGITLSFLEDFSPTDAKTRMRRFALWGTLRFVANGIIFIILGEQLPNIVRAAPDVITSTGHTNSAWLILYIVAIYAVLTLLRFIWVWISMRFTLFRKAHKDQTPLKPSFKLVAATSFAGVRGTVTLAGVMTLPLFLTNGEHFPARDLAVFIAAGVIVLSLITASFVLPFLLSNLKLPKETYPIREETYARTAAYKAAIQAVSDETNKLCKHHADTDIYTNAGARVMQIYRNRLSQLTKNTDSKKKAVLFDKNKEAEKTLYLKALKAEREVFYEYKHNHRLSEERANKILHGIDLMEAQLVESS